MTICNDKVFIIRLSREKHTELKKLAADHGKTMNFIVNQALREFLIKHSKIKTKDCKDTI